MPIAISPEQRALQASIRDWAQRAGTLALVRRLEPGVPGGPAGPQATALWAEQWAALAGLGVFSIALPETAAALAWDAARAADEAPGEHPLAAAAAAAVVSHGTPAQRERFAGPTLRGEITWCQLFSEPDAGSDLASVRTRAERMPGAGDGGGPAAEAVHAFLLSRCLSIAGGTRQILLSVVAARALGLPREEAR